MLNLQRYLHLCLTKSKSSGSGLIRSQTMKKNKVDLDSISTSNDINYLMQLIVCDDIHEMITNSKLIGKIFLLSEFFRACSKMKSAQWGFSFTKSYIHFLKQRFLYFNYMTLTV
jgi:hypothetical protein